MVAKAAVVAITNQMDAARLGGVRCASRWLSLPKAAMMSKRTDHSDDTDAGLLQAYAAGDPSAARTLSDRLLPRIVGQAMRMLQNRAEADDVAQDAMLRLWKIAPQWDPTRGQVTTWVYRVVSNLCMDRLRARAGVGLDEIAEPIDPTPGVETKLQNSSRAEALSWALAQLPERQAQAVALRHLEGLSNPQIAEIMDIGPRAVESLTARGKAALTDILQSRRAELGYSDEN